MTREISVSEIRDFFCCPYIWWFRNLPLRLEDQERLQRVKQEPGMARHRTMPFEVKRTGYLWLFSIACAVSAVVAWVMFSIFRGSGSIGLLVYSLMLIGTVFVAFSIYGIVRWYGWRRRTPAYDRAILGEVLFWGDVERERKTVHAASYGIVGDLNCVARQGRKLATTESRSVETPKFLLDQDRMQAVAQALLAEVEFGARPERAYVVYPDRTFEVRMVPAEVGRLQAAVRIMRTAVETGQMPEASPARHLCSACPITACPKRIAAYR